jgi:hypothetical protein
VLVSGRTRPTLCVQTATWDSRLPNKTSLLWKTTFHAPEFAREQSRRKGPHGGAGKKKHLPQKADHVNFLKVLGKSSPGLENRAVGKRPIRESDGSPSLRNYSIHPARSCRAVDHAHA